MAIVRCYVRLDAARTMVPGCTGAATDAGVPMPSWFLDSAAVNRVTQSIPDLTCA